MKQRTILTAILAASLIGSAIAGEPLDPAKDLSKATRAEVINYAREEAKEFWATHKTKSVSGFDLNSYISGRGIKHNLGGTKYDAAYFNTWNQVLTQLRIDGE